MLQENSLFPKYFQLEQYMVKDLLERNLQEKSKFDSIRTIMKKYSVSNLTVQKAVSELNQKGILNTSPQDGIYIASVDKARRYYLTTPPINRPEIINVAVMVGKSGLIEYDESPVFIEVLNGARNFIAENPSVTLKHLCFIREEMTLDRFVVTLKENDINAILNVNVDPYPDEHKEFLKKNSLPVVFVNVAEDNGFHAVDMDNFGGAYESAEYLIGKKRSKIAIIKGPANYQSFEHRFEGHKKALLDNGINLNDELILEVKIPGREDGYWAVKKLLDRGIVPDAVLTPGDYMAFGAIQAINEKSLSIPEDISVIGYLDLIPARLSIPRLTTVRAPMHDMGYKAMDILFREKKGELNKTERITLKTEMIVRDTSI